MFLTKLSGLESLRARHFLSTIFEKVGTYNSISGYSFLEAVPVEAHQPMHALLLNANYEPIRVITWKRAVELLFDGRADLVEAYADRFIRSAKLAMAWPAVLRLRQFVAGRARVRFNRQNVLARDAYRCAYCEVVPLTQAGRPRIEELTIDHVIPRAQSKGGKVRHANGKTIPVTCWENVVCCCVDCNLKKADRTPGQAGMPLRFQPRSPSAVDVLRMLLRKIEIPNEWTSYLPSGARDWRGYWTEELDQD